MLQTFISIILTCFCVAPLWAQDLTHPRPAKRAPITSPVAQQSNSTNAFYFNLGSHTEFYNNIQTDTSGGVRKINFAPTLGFGMLFPLSSGYKFLPEINWVLPLKSESPKVIKNLFMFRADIGYEPVEWFRLRLGTSIMWLNQHGQGGKAVMNNGNDYSTFYYPDENRSSLNNTLDVGAEAFLSKAWSTRLQTYVYSVFREDRRQISYTLFLSYYWGR
jgi:hypothetical protein